MRKLLILPLAVILLVTGLLASMLAGQAISGYRDGLTATKDVERLRLLLSAQVRLSLERVATNAALSVERPMSPMAATQLAQARQNSSQVIEASLAFARGQHAGKDNSVAEIEAIVDALRQARMAVDSLLAQDRSARSYRAITAATEQMIGVVPLFQSPVLDAVIDTTVTDPDLAGLLNVARLAINLRESAGRIANIFVVHLATHAAFDDADVARLRTLQGVATELDRMIREGLQIADAGDPARQLAVTMHVIYRDQIDTFLETLMETGGRDGRYQITAADFTSRFLAWSNSIVAVWEGVLGEATARVNNDQLVRLRGLRWAAGSIGAVFVAVLAALLLLHHYVVVPVTRLGDSLLRIASGERTAELSSIRGPKEIAVLADAVEALRRVALVADATETRDRIATQQRASLLQHALVIALTVREPAHQLAEIAERLADHLAAASAEMADTADALSPALDAVAELVRSNVAAMRESSFLADNAMEALQEVSIDGHLGAAQELAARLVALQTFVDDRDTVVKRFSRPVLAALNGMAEACRADHQTGQGIDDLLIGPFLDVQEVVATVARMRDAIARANEALQKVATEETKAAA